MNNAPANQLTSDQIDAIAQAMPGGLDGFLKQWGWQQFARAVIEKQAAFVANFGQVETRMNTGVAQQNVDHVGQVGRSEVTTPTFYKLGTASTRPDEHGQSVSYPAMVPAAPDDAGPLYVSHEDHALLSTQFVHLLSACRIAVLALSAASQRDPAFLDDYEKLSSAISASAEARR